jgi:hypothetical protein
VSAARLAGCLAAVEASLAIVVLALSRAPGLRWALLSSSARWALVAGALGVAGCGWLLWHQVRAAGPRRGRLLAIAVAVNLGTLLVALGTLDAAVRMAARRTPDGLAVGSVVLPPTWAELTARSRDALAGATPGDMWDPTFLVPDAELGWTLAPSRRSADGLYASSAEGLRSAEPGVRLADGAPRPRVALIGDSIVFSLEVPFEDSWGAHLGHRLGKSATVLNFAVDGYGLDQTYLRYRRDVSPWKPAVVVIGLAGHELQVTTAAYPFVTFEWAACVVKPRFTLEGEGLRPLNVPLPAPETILAADRIERLPLIDLEPGYARDGWRWRLDRGPLVFRYLASALLRRSRTVSSEWAAEIVALNQRLLTALVDAIERDGAVPLLMVMADREDPLLTRTLAGSRPTRIEAAECLREVPADRRRVASGFHYTGRANEALAGCTAPVVERALGGAQFGTRTIPPR